MEKCSENKEDITGAILAFDTLYTTNHMKIFKLLLPYLEVKQQKKLAIFIKLQELMFTLNFFNKYSVSLYNSDFTKKKNFDFNSILPILTAYCSPAEKDTLSKVSQIQNMMHVMEEIQQYMPIIQQLMSSGIGENSEIGNLFGTGENNATMEQLKNMLSEEQQAMFSMFMGNDL